MRISSRRPAVDSSAELAEARSDVTAVTQVLMALDGAVTEEQVARAALDTVRQCFG